MSSTADLVDRVRPGAQLAASAEPAAPAPLPARVATALFDRLTEYLGGRMADLFAGVERAKVEASWAAALSGFSREELARGVAAVSESPYAPTLGEFKRMCRPALDPERAFWEAEAGLAARSRGEPGAWSHPAIWRAASAMAAEVRAGQYPQVRRRWERALASELQRGWLEDVPAAPVQIEFKNPAAVAASPEVRRKLAEITKKFKELR